MEEPGVDRCVGADFCRELIGLRPTEFSRTYRGDPPERIIARGRNLTLIADLSPLCVGHLLIVSNVHYLSFAEVVRDHEGDVAEFLEWTTERYARCFAPPVILEHGSSPGMDGSACITHAHLHILPLPFDAIHQILVADGLCPTELDDLADLGALADQKEPYLYCGDGRRGRVYPVRRRMRRQYLRSVAGSLLGIPDPEWDYAVVVRTHLLRRTMLLTAHWSRTN